MCISQVCKQAWSTWLSFIRFIEFLTWVNHLVGSRLGKQIGLSDANRDEQPVLRHLLFGRIELFLHFENDYRFWIGTEWETFHGCFVLSVYCNCNCWNRNENFLFFLLLLVRSDLLGDFVSGNLNMFSRLGQWSTSYLVFTICWGQILAVCFLSSPAILASFCIGFVCRL